MSNRRAFLKNLGGAAFSAPFITRQLLAAPPSRILRHASFGGGGMAWNDVQALTTNPWVKLVAVADVDLTRVGELKAAFPNVKVYQDWRQLLDKEHRNIDSVNVSVPDHMHAPIALSAMQLGKHCYCQKPLAHDIHETRVLTRYARSKKLVTQMGIQIHSHRNYRQAVALLQTGAIGKIKEVHSWSSKKWGDAGAPPATIDPVPAGFDWDVWLGVAAARPYSGAEYYHPANWRKRLDFGTGTFGDMGCHILDPVFKALELTAPSSVRSEGPPPDRWNWPNDAHIKYIFPATRYTVGGNIPVTWYDGDARPPVEIRALIEPNTATKPRDLVDQGSIFVGTAGVLHLPHPGAPRLYPTETFRDYPMPATEQGHHWTIFAEACVDGGTPSANFDYSGPLTEMVLLGSVAVRFPRTTLLWDSEKLRFTNETTANQHVRRTYRKGWEVAGL